MSAHSTFWRPLVLTALLVAGMVTETACGQRLTAVPASTTVTIKPTRPTPVHPSVSWTQPQTSGTSPTVADPTSPQVSTPTTGSSDPGTPAGKPLSGKIITVDPGHNGGNAAAPGVINQIIWNGRENETCDTTGTETDAGYTEALFNFNVATYLAADLRAEGATVVLTRSSNTGVGPCVTERAAIGNNAHSNAAISIHADGGPPNGRGFAVLEPVSDGINAGIVAPSQVLGADIRNTVLADTGEPVSSYDGIDGIQPRDDLAGLNLSTVPKVLVECANMRNATDAALLTTPQWQQTFAGALAAGLTHFLGGVLRAQSVTSNSSGAENVFWRTASGQLVHDYFTGPGGWHGPQPLAGSLRSDPAAIATHQSGLDVFYVGSNGGLFHSYFTGNSWVENAPLPGSSVTGGLTVTSNSSGTENVFWRTTTGQLVHDYFTGPGGWHGPQPLAGSLQSDPAAIATHQSGLDVFYVGSNGGLFHTYFTGNSWVENAPLPGSSVTGGLTVTSNSSGTENVFWRTTSGQLVHDYFTGSGAWVSGLVAGTGVLTSDPIALAVNADGLDAFFAGYGGGLWHSFSTSPRSSWVTLRLPGSAIAGFVVPVLTYDGGEDAFFSTSSGALSHDYFTGSGPWIGPSSIPS